MKYLTSDFWRELALCTYEWTQGRREGATERARGYAAKAVHEVMQEMEWAQELDPKAGSAVLASLSDALEAAKDSIDAASIKDLACIGHIMSALCVFREAHERFGLAPTDVEQLARRYRVEMRRGWPDERTLPTICERALAAKLRSDKALLREKRASDVEILTVIASVKGRARQAKKLNLSVRQLQRRLREMRRR